MSCFLSAFTLPTHHLFSEYISMRQQKRTDMFPWYHLQMIYSSRPNIPKRDKGIILVEDHWYALPKIPYPSESKQTHLV